MGFSYREHVGLLLAMSMLVIAGAAAGSRLLDRVDEVLFTRLYRTVLVLVALRLVSSAAWMGDVAATVFAGAVSRLDRSGTIHGI